MGRWLWGLAGLVCVGLAVPAAAQDRHAGYYYPEPSSREVYVAAGPSDPRADRRTRVAFVTGLTQEMLDNPYAPQVAVFAKGARAEKLIVVALRDDSLNTLYRMRGLLAIMTSSARLTPLFQEAAAPEELNFLDLLKLLGFELVTVSDGDAFAHQIAIE